MRSPSFCCLTNLWALIGLACLAYASPPVKVHLRSSWPAPSLLLEILETASIENHDFLPLLDLLTSPDVFPQPLTSLTSKAIHDVSVRALLDSGRLSEPGALESFEISLSLHTASPKIEAFYEFYRDHNLAEVPLVDGEAVYACTGSWVEWYGRRVCSVDTLRALIEGSLELANGSVAVVPAKLLSFDHIYPPASGLLHPPSKTAILYGEINSRNLRSLHNYMYSLTQEKPPRLQYVYRHIPPETQQDLPNYLSGYGVTLDLKKMDYLALDDRKHSRGTNYVASTHDAPDRGGELEHAVYEPLDVLGDTGQEVDLTTPLDEEEISSIGVKCAQLVMLSPDPLKALIHLSQNFPKYATSIARRVIVNSSLIEELQNNQHKAQEGLGMVWLNGMVLQNTDVNVFSLLRILRKEREIIGQISDLGLSASQAIDLLTHEAVMLSQAGNRAVDGIFDASDRPEEGGVIMWWNDLEKDSRYARWSPALHMLLRPTYAGQFHNIRRNIYNIVLLLDLSQRASLAWITGPVFNIIQRGLPFRFGVVPIVETEEGLKAARLVYYLVETYGRSKTMTFLKTILQSSSPNFDFRLARAEFQTLAASTDASPDSEDEPREKLDFDTVIGLHESASGQDFSAVVEKARMYAHRLGANLRSSPQGHAFINGKHANVAEDFLTSLQLEIAQQTQYLQEQLYSGNLTDDVDVSVYFYDLPMSVARRNRHIYPASGAGRLRVANLMEIFSRLKVLPVPSDFIYPAPDSFTPISMWIVTDFDKTPGQKILKDALTSMKEDANYRIALVHNPSEVTEETKPSSNSLSCKLSRLHVASSLNQTHPKDLLAVLNLQNEAVWGDAQKPLLEQSQPLREAFLARDDETAVVSCLKFFESSRLLARELEIAPGQQMLIVNGRIVGPIDEDEFTAEDFPILADYELSKRIGPVLQAYTNITNQQPESISIKFADDIAKLSSIVSAAQIPDPSAEGLFNIPQRPRNRAYNLLNQLHSSFKSGNIATASYQFAFILDPASEQASRWAPLISWLSSLDSVHLQVHLNPVRLLSELPLKQFYRFTLPPHLLFDESGAEVLASIEFRDLPPDPIYTLGVDVPTAWLVRPHESHHDLDNIHLASFTGIDRDAGVEAIFDLDYLVVEGHARDAATNTPPRGLQLQLTTSNSTPIADTQVVANLGYLQFKAKPGVFQLEIRDGYGRQVFEIESVGNEGWNSSPVTSAGVEITVTNLEGLTLYPRFRTRSGMEEADVLAEPVHDKSTSVARQVISSFSSLLWPTKQVSGTTDGAEINIFTVASGLLYERFVSIMILSVLRNTKSTVKFWFIENFLSPSFLEFIPHFADAYNFQYELVTYKWPSWLRAQKEKQRVIWAYKILFLDVLFPMDLKKVIFVDADQIVRADLKELVDLDLHGAPYGYTPMGDDNTDMEGFRFWKTGYWKDFLRGRPYHISALYVIDLVRFRQLAAGDRLRGSYQSLSADPNSLSNLDQDLPNNLQHEVPIFSLPEDWLWCETWCSKERLYRAKTIDLCQNPLTKEPKLSRARQIPEWEEYDAEASQFARKLADHGLIRSAAYARGADTLANVGSARPAGEQMVNGGSKVTSGQVEDGASDSKIRDEL